MLQLFGQLEHVFPLQLQLGPPIPNSNSTTNTRHSTPAVQHAAFNIKCLEYMVQCSAPNVPHPPLSVQHPEFNVQCPTPAHPCFRCGRVLCKSVGKRTIRGVALVNVPLLGVSFQFVSVIRSGVCFPSFGFSMRANVAKPRATARNNRKMVQAQRGQTPPRRKRTFKTKHWNSTRKLYVLVAKGAAPFCHCLRMGGGAGVAIARQTRCE